MNVISLKDYAKRHNITYEAVRKQVSRFKSELSEHIIQDGKQQLLDEEAVAFLDARRERNPISIIQQDKDDTISALEDENKNLLQQIVVLQNELLREKDLRISLAEKAAKVALLEESRIKTEMALESVTNEKNKLQARAEEAEGVNDALIGQADKERQRAESLQAELDRRQAELDEERSKKISFREYWRRRKG